VVATPAGRGVVLADVVIDGTGNADIAAAAGAPFIHTGGEFLSVQGTGLPPRALGASYTNTDYTFVDDSDMVDVWRLFVSARQKYRGAFDLGQLIDTRERRRIKGEVVVSILDQMNDRTYRDTIGMCKSDFDMHGFPVHPFFVLSHPQRKSLTTYIPYRCLLPANLEGMLVIGLGISVHRDALPGTRMQPDIQNVGYAAGTAAAMAAKSGGMTRAIDVPALQKHLAEIGNIPASAVGAKESYPMPDEKIAEAVRSLAKDYGGTAVVLAHRDKAVSMLEEAYRKAADEKTRRIYAHVLAVCGSSSGVDTLIAAVKAAEKWDRGWNFKGMGQYGWALSPLDRWIVALGMAGEKRAVPVIVEKLKMLTPASEFSHHRAVSLALELIGDKSAAGPLAELLAEDGMAGHAMLQPAAGSDRSLPLREIIIARALYRLGDHKHLARKSLESFTQDVRGHFARHASAILQAGRK
ncbi:MAG: FAD-dependent oxidoreductase, partial [Phycisphaerae bacterium]